MGASPVGKREKVCVSAAKAELQRLKPLGFGTVYVVAKATTHKDSQAVPQAPACATTVAIRGYPWAAVAGSRVAVITFQV